jgi:Ala-tRNA(Pro) deacylase
MPEQAMSMTDFLTDHQVPFETIYHAPAFSAQKRAKYLHTPGKQVAKCVLLVGGSGYLLAVLPATQHIDLERLKIALEEPVRIAEDREIAWVFRDCEWGVVPPFGTLYGLPTILEESVDPDALLVFEGRLHAESIRLLCSDYEKLEHPRRLRFAS